MDNDPFLYDTERLHRLASSELVKQGLRYFSENRVISVELENDRLVAQVEGADDEVYWLGLTSDASGNLAVDCDCNPEQAVCVHAVAALYAYADQYGQGDGALLGSAVDEAIQERVKKGRNEVRVTGWVPASTSRRCCTSPGAGRITSA
ncbi:MAG: helicase [Proteobacteria bacterium]|nr:helicase [Pseudomonadota bacterium]